MLGAHGHSRKRGVYGRCISRLVFTGLIEDVGTVAAVERMPEGARLSVRTRLPGLTHGSSIAVDGVCLTAVELARGRLTADGSARALRKRTLGGRQTRRGGELGRARAPRGRLGG